VPAPGRIRIDLAVLPALAIDISAAAIFSASAKYSRKFTGVCDAHRY
jgi:hypothetical protein